MRFPAVLLCASILPLAVGQAAPPLLRGMREQARPVVLFGGDHDPRVTAEYNELLQHADAMRERQMRIVLATRTPTPATPAPPSGTVAATEPEQAALRSTFHLDRGAFALVLIGKDGGEKFRSAQPVRFEALRAIVDSMPMRQQEMRSH